MVDRFGSTFAAVSDMRVFCEPAAAEDSLDQNDLLLAKMTVLLHGGEVCTSAQPAATHALVLDPNDDESDHHLPTITPKAVSARIEDARLAHSLIAHQCASDEDL